MRSRTIRPQPRTVKPRAPQTNADRPIVVILDSQYCTEQGDIGDIDTLLTDLRTMPPSIIVSGNESASVLRRIQNRWGALPNFQFRVSPVEREIFTGKNTGRKLTLSLTSVSWFGWHGEKCGRNNTLRNRYHLLIDPLTFSGAWLSPRTFKAYLAWATALRAFCMTQGWNIAPTQGAVARQALRDPRFYPHARRKVPLATNERVRPHLPGNHYQLLSETEDIDYEVDYLDQSRCHHYHAAHAKLPDANTLFGYGHFRDPQPNSAPYKTGERAAKFLEGFYGLIYATIYWPLRYRKVTRLVPPYLTEYDTAAQPAYRPLYILTEDLPLLESLGVTITGIVAAWGSYQRDTGLAKYANWALAQLGPDAPSWLKTLLLSPYGALATTARRRAVAYHRSEHGDPRDIRTKYGTILPVSFHHATKVSEPSTNNVLHRALIESSNRTETLLYARLLESLGYEVLAIHVDALIVTVSPDLPPPPIFAPWRIDQRLSNIRFLSCSATRFVSPERQRLPGITGAHRNALIEKFAQGG